MTSHKQQLMNILDEAREPYSTCGGNNSISVGRLAFYFTASDQLSHTENIWDDLEVGDEIEPAAPVKEADKPVTPPQA